MIKLNRGKCPTELTSQIKNELTKEYIQSKTDVWKDSRIREPLKNELLRMSNKKCAYCECKIDVENNYFTVEHFIPKSGSKYKVLEWDNLLPACGRCNGCKTGSTEDILDPSKQFPNEYLALSFSEMKYAIVGKRRNVLGENTWKILRLNDIKVRLMRFEFGEKVLIICKKVCIPINSSIESSVSGGRTPRLHYSQRESFSELLGICSSDQEYSAVSATMLFGNKLFIHTVEIIKKYGLWNSDFERLYNEMLKNKLESINS